MSNQSQFYTSPLVQEVSLPEELSVEDKVRSYLEVLL